MMAGFERPSDAWFMHHGFPSFRMSLQLPVGVSPRVLCQQTVERAQSASQPLGTMLSGHLGATTHSSAFSSVQSWQVVRKSVSGTADFTAAIAVEVSGPMLGHSDHSSTASEGTALLAHSPMNDSSVTDRLQVASADKM